MQDRERFLWLFSSALRQVECLPRFQSHAISQLPSCGRAIVGGRPEFRNSGRQTECRDADSRPSERDLSLFCITAVQPRGVSIVSTRAVRRPRSACVNRTSLILGPVDLRCGGGMRLAPTFRVNSSSCLGRGRRATPDDRNLCCWDSRHRAGGMRVNARFAPFHAKSQDGPSIQSRLDRCADFRRAQVFLAFHARLSSGRRGR